ncbi:MAG TPA: 30S ribosomal protein S1 [Nitrospiria bacterium]|nr:30S ribosomal protein S1 [Nitrospiria bacterium]
MAVQQTQERGQTDSAGDRTRFDELYSETFKNLQEGSLVDGRVVAFLPDGVVVDIGYKSEGIIPQGEFSEEELKQLSIGAPIQVFLEAREDLEGNLVLSKEKADRMKVWGDLEKLHQTGQPINGKIVSRVKGGLIIDIGVKAFLPGSQVDLRPTRDLDRLLGQTVPVKIIKMNHLRSNVVVSRRVLLEESRERKRQETLSNIQEGQWVDGVVKNITEYGAFVDLGGVDGLLHITDMSWGRISHPSELFSVGQKVSVMILRHDKETGRISLGYKQKSVDPWLLADQAYPVGSRVKGKVVSVTDYGAFVELEPGVEGLIHISEMSWSHEVKHPSKLVSVGQQVEAVVLSIDPKARKISLGMKQVEPNPWEVVEQKYPVGSVIEGTVKSLTDFGVFVGLEEGIDGLIHVSDLSWTKRVTHPSELLNKGDRIKAVVLKIDPDKERLSLGYKQLTLDPWEEAIARFKTGQQIEGKVIRHAEFGFFVELAEGVEGLVHASEAGGDAVDRQSQKLEELYPVGQTVTGKIVKIDRADRKISLSIKAYQKDAERDDLRRFHEEQGALDQSLGHVAGRSKRSKKGDETT